jgi:transcriptional regulator with XRE-family HTH domain
MAIDAIAPAWQLVGPLAPNLPYRAVLETSPMRKRVERNIRKFIGQRLRALRKERDLTQERLGHLAGLSGKFIGEVERGEKSISIDSLYAVAIALHLPLRSLVDVRVNELPIPGSEEAERIYALMAGPHRQEDLRRAYNVLRAMFGRVS